MLACLSFHLWFILRGRCGISGIRFCFSTEIQKRVGNQTVLYILVYVCQYIRICIRKGIFMEFHSNAFTPTILLTTKENKLLVKRPGRHHLIQLFKLPIPQNKMNQNVYRPIGCSENMVSLLWYSCQWFGALI